MKIILTGATGFVGAHALRHLVADPAIERVTCLTRRPLDIRSPKVEEILHTDFMAYDGVAERLAGHQACLWTLGGKASDMGTPEVYARITHGFTLALAQAMAARVSAPFRFCYLSGMGADPTETARFAWERLTRHLKGRTEKDLQLLQERFAHFSCHCFRPGGILPDDTNRLLRWILAPISVRVGTLCDAMIAAASAEDLFRRAPVISNGAIKRLARRRGALLP